MDLMCVAPGATKHAQEAADRSSDQNVSEVTNVWWIDFKAHNSSSSYDDTNICFNVQIVLSFS